ncbi:MAG: hypothetical protein ABW155_07580, partial [Candidatus Thiodiazotropha sp.]
SCASEGNLRASILFIPALYRNYSFTGLIIGFRVVLCDAVNLFFQRKIALQKEKRSADQRKNKK